MPIHWDRYAYTSNDPVRYIDPSGHIACDDVDGNGKCVSYKQLTHRMRKNLENFVQPSKATEDQMSKVGVCGIACSYLSPKEYSLVTDNSGGLDVITLLKMRKIQQDALRKAQELFPGMDLLNDAGDAFRHAYWSALITKEFGKDFALAFTNAHETQFSVESNVEQVFMDLHNNSVGINLAVTSPDASAEELVTLALGALNEGVLYVWNETAIYLSNLVP